MHEELAPCAFHEGCHKGLGSVLQKLLEAASRQGHITCPANEGHLQVQYAADAQATLACFSLCAVLQNKGCAVHDVTS